MIVNSWKKNVQPWIRAIKNKEITSRVSITNDAILNAVLSKKPKNMLDVGCGEGWLIRAAVGKNIDCLGIDIISEFSNHVTSNGGRFLELPYEELDSSNIKEQFDVIVCNFSLLGNESVENVVINSIELLNLGGTFIVQTIHPREFANDNYIDGWREGTWEGFNKNFVDPAPWYFRTIESWESLFSKAGYGNLQTIEPLNPNTGKPVSIIFEAIKYIRKQV